MWFFKSVSYLICSFVGVLSYPYLFKSSSSVSALFRMFFNSVNLASYVVSFLGGGGTKGGSIVSVEGGVFWGEIVVVGSSVCTMVLLGFVCFG